MASIRMTLGHRFVQLPLPEEEPEPGEGPLEDVLPLSSQYRWLAERAGDDTLEIDPGTYDSVNGYPVTPFTDFLDDLLGRLPDPGITYTSELYLLNHVIREGHWTSSLGHIFRVLANDEALTQEARIGDDYFDVEILVSIEVLD